MANDIEGSVTVAAGGAALAIAVAGALLPLRAQLGGANAALLLVLVVVAAAALGGRVAGVATGLAAALAFNFLYSPPYLTLRIESGRDIVSTGLIVVVGLAVGELAVARNRQSATRRSHLHSMRSLEGLGAMVSAGRSASEVWEATQQALVENLNVLGATFVEGDTDSGLPCLERDGRIDLPNRKYRSDGFTLPETGVVIAVDADGMHFGNVVLEPDPEVGITREQRRTAVAIVDQFAIALRQQRGATERR